MYPMAICKDLLIISIIIPKDISQAVNGRLGSLSSGPCLTSGLTVKKIIYILPKLAKIAKPLVIIKKYPMYIMHFPHFVALLRYASNFLVWATLG